MPKSYSNNSKIERISDTVESRHHKITHPAPTPEDRIMHSIQQLTAVLKGDGVSASDAQMKAIEVLQSTLNKWSDDDTKNEKEPVKVKEQPGQVKRLPRVQRKPLGVLQPAAQPVAYRTRAKMTKQKPQPEDPIASRTRSKTQSEDVISAVVQELLACSVLDADTGEMLEFRQLRRHPKYKKIWDTYYSNELGRLCQGVGKNSTMPSSQRIKGTDTFRVIKV